ncbi:hypothetical protein E2C01_004514 [Portunus trituberculatus]|uniref:Secreted protein n=1 Tax=Portunus trituberculatus TaxID=210409 RepID=A0A5B7CQQ5_PORTR|nr:hypothetical protein [Portunus trituberculatus]
MLTAVTLFVVLRGGVRPLRVARLLWDRGDVYRGFVDKRQDVFGSTLPGGAGPLVVKCPGADSRCRDQLLRASGDEGETYTAPEGEADGDGKEAMTRNRL